VLSGAGRGAVGDERLAATDGMHHFDLIAFAQRRGVMLAARDDIQIELDRDSTPGQVQAGQQRRNSRAVGQFKGFTVQLNAHAKGSHHFRGRAF